MFISERRADVIWHGGFAHGQGSLRSDSGAFEHFPITRCARLEHSTGKTCPEELLAASLASCQAMAMAHTLEQRGYAPDKITVQASCIMENIQGAPKITGITLIIRGSVPAIDANTFDTLAIEADRLSPVANALRNNVEIRLNTALEYYTSS